MRYAIVDDGIVSNVAVAEAAIAENWIASDTARIGDTWDGTDFRAPTVPLDERKAVMKRDVKARQQARFAKGWTHDFGAAGTHTLDLRDADDKANWTLLLLKTQAMIAAGAGAAPVQLRTQANETIETSATDAQTAMVLFLAWGEGMLSNKWALDAAIDAGADDSTLDMIDIGAGWP